MERSGTPDSPVFCGLPQKMRPAFTSSSCSKTEQLFALGLHKQYKYAILAEESGVGISP
jgi:hypothetical protein